MDPERWRKIEALYEAARGMDAARRAAVLEEGCGGDESLLREVESLLGHGENAGRFLEVPAVEMLPEAARPVVGGRVSHYEIQEKLGEGGMGVVYKARDTRLGRSVALKFVKAQFSERFEREARAIAALNHPHIATLHDVGGHEGAPYLAMEFVEGRPLKGPRPLKEVIEYGIQIADALAAAHAAGIVHRDLKPANILVTEKGSVKILDFGLAKLRAQAGDGEPATATLTGVSAGTPGYMSPEQIDGKRVDSRSDIFAFGCVLYELASGRHAFEGDSVGSVLAATTLQEPKPLDGVPEELEKLIHRCLRKDREQRLQHIGDARIALEELKEGSDSGTPEPVAVPRPVRRWAWAVVALAVVLAAAGWLWFSRSRPASPEASLTAVPLTSFSGIEVSPSFSPEGNQVAFSWNGENEDNYDIYVQMIGSGRPLRLTTDPASDSAPAWSPDGKQIAFLRALGPSRLAVVLIPPLGGPERRLAELQSGVGLLPGDVTLAWHPGGKHLAVADAGSLYLLSTESGEKQRLTTPPQARSHRNPAFSPDGRSLAFSRGSSFVGDLYLLSLDAGLAPLGEPARLTTGLEVANFPVWTVDGGEIIFSGGLFLAPNLWRMAVSGPGKPQRLASVGEGGSQPALARDGRRLTYSRMACDSNIWRIEVPARETATPRRTRLITSSRADMLPQFSPDGSRIAFQSDRSGTSEIWVCNSDGSNAVPVTSFGGPLAGSPRWSPDGEQIAFDSLLEGHFDVFVVSAGGGKPRRLTTNPAQDLIPTWSRDGRWIYFQSNRSGSSQVWKMPAPGLSAPKEPIQVTQNGGGAPVESHDGRLVYYVKSGELWQVPAAGGEETQALGSVYNARSFSVADKGIYFIPREEAAVRFFDFDTRTIRTVATLGQSRLGDLAVSPNGRTILYTQVDSTGGDLMLVENFR